MATITQAGAIVVRPDASGARVLLVTARRHPEHWVFPKGHVEPGESLEESAVREAREEAGVSGRSLGPAGRLSFALGPDTYDVHYFVLVTADAGEEREGRRLIWCTVEDALARLPFENARRLLASARRLVESAGA